MLEAIPPVDLATLRVVFCHEFMSPADWNATLKRPTDTLFKNLPEGISVRAYGWHHNSNHKEESVIGFFKLPKGEVDPLLSRSGLKPVSYTHLTLPTKLEV